MVEERSDASRVRRGAANKKGGLLNSRVMAVPQLDRGTAMTRKAACIGLNLASMGLDPVITRGTSRRQIAVPATDHDVAAVGIGITAIPQ